MSCRCPAPRRAARLSLLSPAQVEVYKSFRPGDIVLAKVVSFPLGVRRGQGVQGVRSGAPGEAVPLTPT